MYFFLSFRDSDLNVNLGACIVQADSQAIAIHKAWLFKINPGGEVLGYSMTEDEYVQEDMELNRLYSPDELEKLGYKKISEIRSDDESFRLN